MTDEERWAAVERRDRTFDGRFVTGVLTTGIYCRPSCAARHPARANVRFFPSGAAAREAGLRPCKRCLPDDVARDEGAVLAAIQAIKASEEPLALADLAARTGYSPTHFQRLFTRHTGLSPAAYARALREERARQALSDGHRVTDAIYDAGFSSPSRFYDNMEGRMGMTASAWVNGGRGTTIHWAVVPTSLGDMLVAATEKGVCRLSFAEGRAALEARDQAETSYAFIAEDVLSSPDPAKSSTDETVIEAMKRASANIDARYARSPGTAARLHLAVARAFYQRSDFDTARAEYARAATLLGKAGEADSEDAVLGRLGSIHMEATSGQPGRLEAAGAAIAKEQKALGDRAKSGRIGFALAQSEGAYAYTADIERAERAIRRAVAIGSAPGSRVSPTQLLKARSSLALVMLRVQDARHHAA